MTNTPDQHLDLDESSLAASGTEQQLYESVHSRVFRIVLPGGTRSLIRKQRLGPAAARRVRHEAAILRRLAGIAGVPRLAGVTTRADVLMLVDDGGSTLAELLPTLRPDLPGIVDLAVAVSRIISAVHRMGVLHKDVNPANIVLRPADHTPVLIDFDLATVFAGQRPDFTHQRDLVGTLAYLAPEQTGRTGRPVDHRADLYSWGATLYELVTGHPPFLADDPLTLIHEHLAGLPVPPIAVDPTLPPALSDIVLRLLAKEPDQRYQSADGLVHDLCRVRAELRAGRTAAFDLGELDFPDRLAPPSRQVGREAETGVLHRALAGAVAGTGRGVLVTGAPGVGKTALIDELRPAVTAAGGWFVTGKFDQYRQDTATDGVNQALRTLGRLLLAEPEHELSRLRTGVRTALGPNARLAATIPELALLLGVPPAETDGDPRQLEARAQRAFVDILGAIASPARPVVLVFDDLQWAGSAPIGLIDAALTARDLAGVLIVGAYRETEVGPVHPLATALARWERLNLAPPVVRLTNLPPADLGNLVGQLLRLPPAQAADLAEAIDARTGGNPFDTIELINALRRDGALVTGADGWHWDALAIRGYVGHGDVIGLLQDRIRALPPGTGRLLEIMACLGGEVESALLRAATGRSAAEVEEALAPALEDGLLVTVRDCGADAVVRFRHDRIQQAAYGNLAPDGRQRLHLTIARRLATFERFAAMAAQQYLPAVGAVVDPGERRLAAGLLHRTATELRLTSDATSERLLAAALDLLAPIEVAADGPLMLALEIDRHRVLIGLGRLAETDAVYAAIVRRSTDPLDLVGPVSVQIASLTSRDRQSEAIELGLALLARLDRGTVAPPGAAGPDLRQTVCDWVSRLDLERDLHRPEVADPRVIGAAEVINCTFFPAFYSAARPDAWPGLMLAAQRLWDAHGPCPPLLASLSQLPAVLALVRGDLRAGYAVGHHLLAVGEARGYQFATAQARLTFANLAAHWGEPLADSVDHAEAAREGLLHGGEIQQACHTYVGANAALLDCAPTLDGCAESVRAGLAFAARTGNNHAIGMFLPYRQLIRALRGETAADGDFADAAFAEAAHLADFAHDGMATATYHIHRALGAALFADPVRLREHTALAAPLLVRLPGFYPTALAYLLRALALADQLAQSPGAGDRGAVVAELDRCLDWMAARAADAPGNFAHLLRWIEAERAAALADPMPAVRAFDLAIREAATRQRPWHRALLAERAARYHLDQGLEHTGRALLAEAYALYQRWGATGKVESLVADHPFLRDADRPTTPWSSQDPGQSAGAPLAAASVSTEDFDLMAVLDASRALSSETNLDRLRVRVAEVLSAMTGATSVRIVLWDGEAHCWYLPAEAGTGAPAIGVEEAGRRGELPLSAFRYAERTGQPLLVEDATADDRFATDRYLAGLAHCSLLVVPILAHGAPRAMLLLENRLGRNAFRADRLDAVLLIAGQLAVSLDNALVYASLERKVAERTEELNLANQQLARLSITDPLTGLANRRRLAQVLDSEWHRARSAGHHVGAIMIDIDHFKLYNDHYGHLAGDACLKRVAGVLTGCVRSTDLVARYGGEEFAVILPGTPVTVIRPLAERVRTAVADLGEPHEQAPARIVTVSLGISALIPGSTATPDRLIETADAALYAAKRAGRNRVSA